MYQNNHLAQKIRQASIGHDDAPFLKLYPSGRTLSYGAFFGHAEQIAAALVRAGIGPGDRVAVQAAKTVTMLELYVGTVLAGAVFLPLNPAYTTPEIRYFLADAAPAILVCDPARFDDLAPIAAKCGAAQVWTLAADETGSLADRRDAEVRGFTPVPRAPLDLAAILYTSGTTGRSKGAMLTHRALASNSETLTEYWQFTERDVLIHALPIFHTHGLFVATNITLMAGGAMIFMPGFDADAICDSMPEATALMGVPTFYTRLLGCTKLAAVAHNMRLFVSGSAPLLGETHKQWRAITGHAILERYGMTETNMNTSNPYYGARRAGTVGLPLPGIDVRVCELKTGAALPPGAIGGLEVRGPNLFAGYWKMPEKTAEELRDDGFFITGDIAQIDTDGYVTIVGRARDMIISGGFNIYPKEIELLIDAVDGVSESAVIGVPHPDFGEAVVAVVVPHGGAAVTPADIRRALDGVLARFKQPKQVVMRPELSRNTMGKVQKNALRQQFADLFSAANSSP